MAMPFSEWKTLVAIHIARAFDISFAEANRYVFACGDDWWRVMYRDGLTPLDTAIEEARAAATCH